MRAVLADYTTAPVTAAEKALFEYIAKVNATPASIVQADVDVLKEHAWSDEAIYDAVTVCGLFNFYNRWVDATGVHPMSEAEHRASGRRIATAGYSRGGAK